MNFIFKSYDYFVCESTYRDEPNAWSPIGNKIISYNGKIVVFLKCS